MRLALLSDIHGNLPAFEAALSHARATGFDRLLILGDIVVGAPDSAECWSLARSLGCPILRGNHERYVAHYDKPQAPPIWKTPQYGPVAWAVGKLSAHDRAALNDLPLTLGVAEHPDVLFVHASARNDTDSVYAHTPDPALDEMFADSAHPLVIRAHNHIAALRLWGEPTRTLITIPSVGLPMDGQTTAQYCTLDLQPNRWKAVHHSVPYSVSAALQRFEDTGYLREAGPMARLFQRELATGTLQVVPFLHAYTEWKATGPISLDAAVDRFFTSRGR